jgi:hypothetical protein
MGHASEIQKSTWSKHEITKYPVTAVMVYTPAFPKLVIPVLANPNSMRGRMTQLGNEKSGSQ